MPPCPVELNRLDAAGDLDEVLMLIDSAVAGRVLVFGSLPPEGRDLDLLVHPPEQAAVEAELARRGFVGHKGTWVRFRSCSAEVVDLIGTGEWGLPAAELAALFSEAEPVGTAAHVVLPAAHHALLVLALQLAVGGGRLGAKRRRRVSAALAGDPDAWDRAGERAAAWDLGPALALLRQDYEQPGRLAPVARFRVRSASRARRRTPCRPAVVRIARKLVRRRPRGLLVAFSGVDGAARAFQAEALCRTLRKLGYEATVERTNFSLRTWLTRRVSPRPRLIYLVDGVADPEQLCTQVARQVWALLR